jgi:hypothetical protein
MTGIDLTAVASESARLILDAARLRVLADGECEAEAESAAMTAEADGPALTALYDALRLTADALGSGLGLTGGCPSSLLLDASVAVAEAFPLGTPESEALGCILGVIADVTEGAMAA